VEALTNNQLKMYLKQHGLKISGSKADLTKQVVSQARGNATRNVLEDEFNNSCEEAQLQKQSQVIPMERTHTLKSHLKYFCARGRHPTRKLGMREPMRGGSRGRGGRLTLILSVRGGRLQLKFA